MLLKAPIYGQIKKIKKSGLDRIRALRVSRPSARRLSISTLSGRLVACGFARWYAIAEQPECPRGTMVAVPTPRGGAGRESSKSHVVSRIRVYSSLMLGR